jgi:hypothetical protein
MASFESFRAVRWVRSMNLVLQAILFLTFFAGLNYLAKNHSARFDLTQYRRYSLSAETLSYVRNLPQNIRVVATVSEDVTDIPVEVRGLINEYVRATETSGHGKVTFEVVNVYRNRRRAEELGLEQPNVLLLISGDRPRGLRMDELYQMKRSGNELVREAFQGEQVLTSAMLEVSKPERQHIYFLVGHGELQPDDTNAAKGLSTLANELRVRNFAVDTLDLSINRRIPEDAALLVAVAPQTAYSDSEREMLRQYAKVNAGRIILLLAPGVSQIRLGLYELLVEDWGITVLDDVIYETDPKYRTDDGDLIVREFAPHPITETLLSYKWYLRWGYTRTVSPIPVAGSGLNVTTVAAVSKTAWGDVGYRSGLPPAFGNTGNTHPTAGMKPEGQLGVVVASERIAPRGNLQFSVRAGRVVVFGSGDFVANQRIESAGNQEVFLRAVNWAVERDWALTVPSRPIERFQLAMSAADLNRMNYLLWFALPGATALLGLIVYWTRRK